MLEGVPRGAPLTRLRGVWGNALHSAAPAAYRDVFEGAQDGLPSRPAYALAELPGPTGGPRVIRWTLLGAAARAHDAALCAAWASAGAQGVGRQGARAPFRVASLALLGPDGGPLPADGGGAGWPLSEVVWPLVGDPATTPCRIAFGDGLHLRRNNRFLGALCLDDLVRSACARVRLWLPPERWQALADAEAAWGLEAATIPAHLEIRATTLEPHWSARQQREREYRVVVGHVAFPQGPGALWRLWLAAHWLQMGRHTTEGLGAVEILQL